MAVGTANKGVIEVVSIADPVETIATMRKSIRHWDEYWEERQEAEDNPQSEIAQEAGAIRGLLKSLITPRLDKLEANKSPHLGLFLNLIVPFDSAGGLRDFILHFFQLEEGKDNHLVYKSRDSYERDVYVLYDLYRVKKTMDVVHILQDTMTKDERIFPSIFSSEEILHILDNLTQVLKLLYTQCLPEKYLRELLPQLSPQHLRGKSLLERRENHILYTFPHVLQKYDYRRFFFLVFFKNGLRARLADGERDFRYNFLNFQVLKHEFMVHWLTGPLRNDPRKYKIYQQYVLHGKSLLQLIVDDPDQEAEILKMMPTHALNDMASQVNEAVPEELKVGVVPESRNFGFYHELKEQLGHAVDMVRAPIETLRKIVKEDKEPPPPKEPASPLGAPPPEPEPEPEPAAAGEIEAHWEISLLKKNQLNKHFLQDSMAGFQALISSQRSRFGGYWNDFSSFATKLLENSPEIRTVRRRTPKHEWSMSYRCRHVTADKTEEYLMVIGVEVRSKPRGMGYQSKESYNFFPYLVFATDVKNEAFGEPGEERTMAGRTVNEYSTKQGAVRDMAMELLAEVKKHEKA